MSHCLRFQLFKTFTNLFLHIFNKWTTPDMSKLNMYKNEYQNMFKEKYNSANVPCYFIDSYYNLIISTVVLSYIHYH